MRLDCYYLRITRQYQQIMFHVAFLVVADCLPDEKVRIVGSLPDLGQWNPLLALRLTNEGEGEWTSPGIIIAPNEKFEFKIIKIRNETQVLWEVLPNNSNRKIKIKYDCKLILTWSLPEGKIINESRATQKRKIELKGKPKKQNKQFDPYGYIGAVSDDSDESEEDLIIFFPRKDSLEMKLNKNQFEEMYYDTTPVETECMRIKQIKLFLISSQYVPESSFLSKAEKQLSEIAQFQIKWLITLNKETMQCKNPPTNEIVKIEQLFLKNSHCIFLDVDSARTILHPRMKACMYLPSSAYEEFINKFQLLRELRFISFDSVKTNLKLRQEITDKLSIKCIQKCLHAEKITIVDIIDQLSVYGFGKQVIIDTTSNVPEAIALATLTASNSIIIIDASLIKTRPKFIENLMFRVSLCSMVIIIESGKVQKETEQLKKPQNNLAIVYQNYSKVLIDGKQYNCLSKFKQVIELLRMKGKLYKDVLNVELMEREYSFSYIFKKEEVAERTEQELINVLKDYDYFTVFRKKCRVKIIWSLSKEIRLIRTLSRIKYVTYGLLGNYSLIVGDNDFSDLRGQLQLMVELRSKYFKKQEKTQVNFYSYGKAEASFTIVSNEL